MTAKSIVKLLEADGWHFVGQNGSHRHPVKPGTIVVPIHKGDLKIGTERAILKRAELL